MKLRSFASLIAAGSILILASVACSSSNSSGANDSDGGSGSGGSGSGGSGGSSSGSSSGGSSSGSSSSGGSSGGSSSGGSSSGGSSSGGSSSGGSSSGGSDGGGSSGGAPFPAGTICNASATALIPPSTLKNLIVILLENENYSSVNGSAAQAPYINELASDCGVATAYTDNCFNADNLVSLPHYLALTSGSNCDTGLDQGASCITTDLTSTSQGTLSTQSIFDQVSSWKAYQEGMPSACDTSTPSGGEYAVKHNPPAFYTTLTGGSSCTTNDLPIAALTCNASTTKTSCGTPSNAFTSDLTNDTLAQFTFITPNLLNDMHDGTVTQADNWLYTYMPLVFASKAYLRGDVAVYLIWDEQNTAFVGGATPNVFISPYIKAGTTTTTVVNHFSALRSFEEALGISTYLGCASGTQPGGGACPAGSTADLRTLLNF